MTHARGSATAERLRALLARWKPGAPLDEAAWEMFTACWGLFEGNNAEGMHAGKLRRAENSRWEPPCVVFEIERHGGTVLGSTRAEVQLWLCNTDTLECTCDRKSYRQVHKRAEVWKVEPDVQRVAAAITLGRDATGLKWTADRQRVRVVLRDIIPPCFQRTFAGRRDRFLAALAPALKAAGWVQEDGRARYTFSRAP